MDTLFGPSRLGYEEKVVTERTLQERLRLAWGTNPDEVRHLLQRNGVTYQIDSFGDMMRFVAFLDKPLAELLDEIKVPRERITRTFIEFHGPLPYHPNRCIIRRVVPGLVSQPKGFKSQPDTPLSELIVQPAFRHIINLPILIPLSIEEEKKCS
jgi:hypothetical protein